MTGEHLYMACCGHVASDLLNKRLQRYKKEKTKKKKKKKKVFENNIIPYIADVTESPFRLT